MLLYVFLQASRVDQDLEMASEQEDPMRLRSGKELVPPEGRHDTEAEGVIDQLGPEALTMKSIGSRDLNLLS